MTLQPVGVAKADITLEMLSVTGGASGWMYNIDYIATIKPNGAFDKKYGYMSAYWAEQAEDATVEGWHLFENLQNDNFYGTRCDTEKIPFGTGIAVFTSQSKMAVTFAGEVLADDYGIPLLDSATTYTGIVCPVKLALEDLGPTGGASGWMYNIDYVATLKTNGSFDKKYGYMSAYWAEQAEDASVEGWHLFENLQNDNFYGTRCDKDSLEAGQAIAVFTSQSKMELVVPSALP